MCPAEIVPLQQEPKGMPDIALHPETVFVLDQIPTGAALVYAGVDADDPDLGRILYANKPLQKILKYTKMELEGLRFQQITAPEYIATDEESFKALSNGDIEDYSTYKQWLPKDGSRVGGQLYVCWWMKDARTRLVFGQVVPDDAVAPLLNLVRDEQSKQTALQEVGRAVADSMIVATKSSEFAKALRWLIVGIVVAFGILLFNFLGVDLPFTITKP